MYDIQALALKISALENKATLLENGFADAMGAMNSVDHVASANFDYDAVARQYKPKSPAGGFIPANAGTNIGNMTEQGGLAGAFDGVTVQASSSGCARGVGAVGYVGKNYSTAPKRITKAEVWPSSNNGYGFDVSTQVTLKLFGKNGAAPTGPADGTQLGVLTLSDTTSGPHTIVSSDAATAWDYVWVRVEQPGAMWVYIAEIKFYEPPTVEGMTLVSSPFVIDPQPETISALVELVEIEPTHPNEDMTFTISRDNGQSWVPGFLVLKAVDGSKKTYQVDVDLLSANAGTSVKWSLSTYGKNIALSGITCRGFP